MARKKLRKCKGCRKSEVLTGAPGNQYTNIAPSLGYCTDCLEKAVAAQRERDHKASRVASGVPACPDCGEVCFGTVERIYGVAKLDVDEATGAVDYAGETDIDWNSQEGVNGDSGRLLLSCLHCGHEWEAPEGFKIGEKSECDGSCVEHDPPNCRRPVGS